MELRFDGCGYSIIGTPQEMWEFLTLDDDVPVPETEQIAPKADQAADKASSQAKQKKKPGRRKEIDWAKARALRNAKWSYEKIADELHCSAQTVINHLKAMEEAEQNE